MLRTRTSSVARPLLVFAALLMTLALPAHAADETPYVELTGRAVLPADTFAAGPPSGFAINGSPNGRNVPFATQPVQGVSAVLPKWNGNWIVMSDNGFGAKANSTDYRLRWYEVDADFAAGEVEVIGYTELSDPAGLVPFPIVNRNLDRVLTGADFDLESFRQAPDGTFWYGEEFGPYLLHTDMEGTLLEAPYATPIPPALLPYARGMDVVKSPDHPDFAALLDDDARNAAANLPRSRGFEGMALNPSGDKLYPLLEGALLDDPMRNRLLIQEFDLERKQYTGNYWFYAMESASHAIGDMSAINDHAFLVIERDNGQGATAEFKKIYLVDLNDAGADGMLNKRLIADLLAITDRAGITQPQEGSVGLGPVFTFPFVTIESVYPVDERTLLVINDNNYPFSTGRRADAPDNNEFILIRLPEALDLDR
jgi:hypothetical protein